MPELRRDPLVRRWVVFSPERKQRPQDYAAPETSLALDSFTAGNEHLTPPEVFAIRPSSTAPNSPGWQVRVVPNRFPALRVEGELNPEGVGIYDRMNGIGAHEVIIETPECDTALEEQSQEGVTNVLKAFRSRISDLNRDIRLRYILIFKNVGPWAGASLKHPHSQLIALPIIPRNLQDKMESARQHYRAKERNIFEDILRTEEKDGSRMVYENSGFAAFCPYASRFPFELSVLPKRQSAHFHRSSDQELELLADTLRVVLKRLNQGLGKPSYNLVLYTAPLGGPSGEVDVSVDLNFRWHVEILPRLGGIAGFEFGSGFFINSTLPEEAAQFLRSVRIKT